MSEKAENLPKKPICKSLCANYHKVSIASSLSMVLCVNFAFW